VKPRTYLIPPICRVGGKSRSLWKLNAKIPRGRVYVEPFGGSAVVLLNRIRSEVEHYCDIDVDLVNFYKLVQSDPESILEAMKYATVSRKMFDAKRGRFSWFYRQAMSFSSKGEHFGRMTKGPNTQRTSLAWRLESIKQVSERLKGVGIHCCDWKVCLRSFDSPETVFYLDPPYLHTSGYAFSPQDHVDLLEMIQSIKGQVAISGRSNKLYDSYKWSSRETWIVKDLVQASSNAKTAEEVLWIR